MVASPGSEADNGRNSRRRVRRRGSVRAWTAGVFSVLLALGAVATSSGVAQAAANCYPTHCYSILSGTGTTFYGMYGTWGRANLKATGATSSNHQWINSEMWAANSAGTAWVETGLTQGWLQPANNQVGYFAFAAYMSTSGTYVEHSFGKVTQNAGTTDEYQISRGSTSNRWNVWFDGTLWSTPAIGFWSTPRLDVGGELFTPNGTAGSFTMYVKGINSSGNKVNLGTQTKYVDSRLNGSKPANSTWKWSTK